MAQIDLAQKVIENIMEKLDTSTTNLLPRDVNKVIARVIHDTENPTTEVKAFVLQLVVELSDLVFTDEEKEDILSIMEPKH